MKSLLKLSLLMFVVAAIAGCAFTPTVTRTLAYTGKVKGEEILEAAVDAARAVNFPPMTKLDKANGIVEFGNFSMDELGITAQVRVRPDNQVDVTVKKGSVYVPLGVDKEADMFRQNLETRLRQLEEKTGK